MSQLLDMVFSPDDTVLIGGDSPATFNTEGEEMLGEALPPRSYHRDLSELDALLGGLGDLGFGETSEKHEAESDEDEELRARRINDIECRSGKPGRHFCVWGQRARGVFIVGRLL